MATLTETSVRVVVELVRGPDGQAAYLTGQSFDAQGRQLRSADKADVTPALTPTQQQAALTLLDAAEAYLKSTWEIP